MIGRDGNENEDGDGPRPRGLEMMILLGGKYGDIYIYGEPRSPGDVNVFHVQCYVGV